MDIRQGTPGRDAPDYGPGEVINLVVAVTHEPPHSDQLQVMIASQGFIKTLWVPRAVCERRTPIVGYPPVEPAEIG